MDFSAINDTFITKKTEFHPDLISGVMVATNYIENTTKKYKFTFRIQSIWQVFRYSCIFKIYNVENVVEYPGVDKQKNYLLR